MLFRSLRLRIDATSRLAAADEASWATASAVPGVTLMFTTNLAMSDIALRLGMALLCGGLIGLNRDLHHKRAGLRTFGLVALATAGMTLGMLGGSAEDLGNVSRVVQGILTGIGFLGAGVILHRPESGRMRVAIRSTSPSKPSGAPPGSQAGTSCSRARRAVA